MPSSLPSTPWAQLSPQEHEYQYNPQHAFPHFARYQTARAPLNDRARALPGAHFDVRYGDHPLHALDIFPAPPGAHGPAPTHIFLHGGYWRAQDKRNFAFIAGALVPLGITTVVANYELCPDSTLDGVAESALSAFEWVCHNVGAYGGDPQRIGLSGHSAGAHLAAEILATDWRPCGVDPSVIKGAALLSGIYDPAPAIATSVNAQLRLDAQIASRHNVEDRPPTIECAVSVIAGGQEPEQWIDQSLRYARHLRRHGLEPAVHVLPGYNHFNILDEYKVPDSTTLRAIRMHLSR